MVRNLIVQKIILPKSFLNAFLKLITTVLYVFVLETKSKCQIQTLDKLLMWIDQTPQVASLLAFLQVITQNISSTGVGWGSPRHVNAVLEGTHYFRSRWRAGIRCTVRQDCDV